MLTQEQVYASRSPNLDAMLDELRSASPLFTGIDRSAESDDTRFCRWDNKSHDGRKHAPAKPWENASDIAVRKSDELCGDLVSLLFLAFWEALARLRARGIEENDTDAAASMNVYLNWLIYNRLFDPLVAEVELSAQWMIQYGWVAIKPSWERELTLRNQRVTMQDISGLATQSPDFAVLPALIQDPSMEDLAVEALTALYAPYVMTKTRAIYQDPADIKPPKASRIRTAVRELREKGETQVPIPCALKNDPCLRALKPWREILIPSDCADIQRRGIAAERVYYTEVALRAEAAVENWDQSWVENACKHKGEYVVWADTSDAGITVTLAADGSRSWSIMNQTASRSQLIEVWFIYTRQLDSDDVPGIYQTICTPLFTKKPVTGGAWFAKHDLLNYPHGQIPIVLGTRERVDRVIASSRGVPEVAKDWQRELKIQRDSIIDVTSLKTLPTVLVPPSALGTKWEFGPGIQQPARPGAKPEFMDTPDLPTLAMEIEERIARDADNYFGLPRSDTPPGRGAPKLQMAVNKFLMMWAGALKQTMALIGAYADPQEWERITARPKPAMDPSSLERGYDLVLAFDVRELDRDFMAEKLKAIREAILPMDTGGVIDRTKLVKAGLRLIDPAWARELIMDDTQASQQLYNKVQNDIALMSLGNEVPYGEEVDPTAPRQLQYAQQIVFGDGMQSKGNPKYQQQIQQDPRFAELMQTWSDNKKQSMMQMQNKQIGRTGVKPIDQK
jgi:hypothetical protein